MEPANQLDEALRLHRAGRLDEAQAIYRSLLQAQPDHADARYWLGLLYLGKGELDVGIDQLRRAAALAPEFPDAYNALGAALAAKRQWSEAVSVFQRTLKLDPKSMPARFNLGVALAESGQVEAAIAAFDDILAREPGHADALCRLGGALLIKHRHADAVAACRKALELRPVFPEASFHLGVALLKDDLVDEAIIALRESLRHRPDYAPAHNALGWAFQMRNQLAPAIEAYRTALRINPQYAEAEMHEGLAHLLAGDLPTGLRKYEARWRAELTTSRHAIDRPQWNGEVSLVGRSILLHAEQGFGDTVQFVRFAPILAARGARVYVEVQPALKALLVASPLRAQVYARKEALPPFDFQCPMVSLAHACSVDLTSVPRDVPYLRPPDDRIRRWRDVGGAGGDLKVGFAWSGNRSHDNDRRRSIPLEAFAPLFAVSGCRFICVQKDLEPREAAILAAAAVTNLSDRIDDFADTAAIIGQLDLVISVDTSIAHLAGALAATTWILLPFAPDWRWMLEREDSPWYPTVRLFRQKKPGDWPAVIETVAAALQRAADARAR